MLLYLVFNHSCGMILSNKNCCGKSHGQRSLVGYSSWDSKESDTTKQLNDIHLAGYSKSYHDPVLNKQNSVHETKIHKD